MLVMHGITYQNQVYYEKAFDRIFKEKNLNVNH